MTASIPPLPMPSVPQDFLLTGEGGGPSRLLFFNEYCRLCTLLKDILSEVYDGGIYGLSNDAAVGKRGFYSVQKFLDLDSKLAFFANSLPPILSWKEPQGLAEIPKHSRLTFETQRVALHGRCVSPILSL
jgi:hypothetical protein